MQSIRAICGLIAVPFAIAIFCPSASAQSTFERRQFGSWTVYGWSNDCWMRATTPDGTGILISNDSRPGDFYLSLQNSAWLSIRDRQVYSVRVQFADADVVVSAYGTHTENSGPPSVGMFLRNAGASNLDILKLATTLRITTQDKPLAQISMTGSAAAFTYFDRCLQAVGAYTSDPFASPRPSGDPFK